VYTNNISQEVYTNNISQEVYTNNISQEVYTNNISQEVYSSNFEKENKININKMTMTNLINVMNTHHSKISKEMFENFPDLWYRYQDFLHENKNIDKELYSNTDSDIDTDIDSETCVPVNKIIKYLDSKKNRKLTILDLGCGRDNLIQNYFSSNPNFNITGYDFISINNCKACDISSLPDESESKNICIICESLIGINWKDYINEAKRVLCFNGLLIIYDLIENYEQTKNYLNELEMILLIDECNISNKWFSIYALNN
jgi:SAM-dependent methyltransferase